MNELKLFLLNLLTDIAETETDVALFFLVCIAAIIVIDAIATYNRSKKKDTGIESKDSREIVSGVTSLSPKKYVSNTQGIAGTPDALIIENGYVIPVERKPMARKIRDRYVAQLLVYMRLVEEFEGKKPPYGYLILGRNCRRVKIENTAKRQKWLQGLLDEMRDILNDRAKAKPAPYPAKCHRCSVRSHCNHFTTGDTPEIAVAEARKSLKVIGD